MSRAARLLELTALLRRHRRPVSGAALAESLGVSLRTLYRDIAELQAIGADVEGEAGVGYMLRAGFLLPPLMFDGEEIEALVLGARWVAEHGDDSLSDAALSALDKIAAVLPSELRARLDDSGLMVGPPHGDGGKEADLGAIRAAIQAEHKLTIAYVDAKGDASERVIWPIAVAFFDRARVVVAWCELRADFRNFRTDRIQAMTVTGARYPRRRAALLKAWRATEGLEC